MQHHVQPRESAPRQKQVSEEIQKFLSAVDSYPARAAKEPGLTFHQHLASLFSEAPNQRARAH